VRDLPCLVNGVENEPGKDPVTRTESLVLTRLPPRAVVGQRINTMVWCSEALVRSMPVTPGHGGRGVTTA
jgi:hypothetical protein